PLGLPATRIDAKESTRPFAASAGPCSRQAVLTRQEAGSSISTGGDHVPYLAKSKNGAGDCCSTRVNEPLLPLLLALLSLPPQAATRETSTANIHAGRILPPTRYTGSDGKR